MRKVTFGFVLFILVLVACTSGHVATTPTASPGKPATTSRLTLATFAPREVLGVNPDGSTHFGDFDFGQLPAMVDAGINEIGAVIEFMTKDGRRQQELRRDFVNAVKPYGIRYYHSVPTYKDPYGVIPPGAEPEDPNFVSGALWLDEPYVYFRAEGAADLVSASRAYVSKIEDMLVSERRGPMCGGCGRSAPLVVANTVESVAWYDLRAGADGFWVEGFGGTALNQIHFFNEYFNLDIPETPENYIRLIAAFERGAANHFGKVWGYGVYSGLPSDLREMTLEGLYDRGATYFFFWANHADATLATEEVISLARHLTDYAQSHVPAKTRATAAILMPAGYHIPGGIYCSGLLLIRDDCIRAKGAVYLGGDLWNTLPAIASAKRHDVNPEHAEVLRALGEAIKEALASGEEFDILVNDESLKPGYVDRYERVVWIGK